MSFSKSLLTDMQALNSIIYDRTGLEIDLKSETYLIDASVLASYIDDPDAKVLFDQIQASLIETD